MVVGDKTDSWCCWGIIRLRRPGGCGPILAGEAVSTASVIFLMKDWVGLCWVRLVGNSSGDSCRRGGGRK